MHRSKVVGIRYGIDLHVPRNTSHINSEIRLTHVIDGGREPKQVQPTAGIQ